MTYAEIDAIVEKALADGSTVVVELDSGDVELSGYELRDVWESLVPGEAFEIIEVRQA